MTKAASPLPANEVEVPMSFQLVLDDSQLCDIFVDVASRLFCTSTAPTQRRSVEASLRGAAMFVEALADLAD